MEQLWRDAWPFLVPALLPAVLLMMAPRLSVRGRALAAVLLGGAGVAFFVDLAVFDHSAVVTHPVVNLFPGTDGSMRRWTVDEATAPLWRWHAFAGAMLLLAGGAVWLRRNAPPGPRRPLLLAAAVFWFYTAVRIGLEACAVWPELVWAAGATPALLAVLPFFAVDRARRGDSFWRYLGSLAVLAWLQRLPLIAFAFVASTRHWGTHLDTHLVTELGGPGGPHRFGDDAVAGWIWLTLIPHLTLWVVVTMVLGTVVGGLPFWLARRGANAARPRG